MMDTHQRVRKDNFMLHYDQLEVRVQLPMQPHQHLLPGAPGGLPTLPHGDNPGAIPVGGPGLTR
jgi:hypothetical protein